MKRDRIGSRRAPWRTACAAAWLALLALLPPGAQAHQASDAYLRASVDAQGKLALQVDVALRDLDVVLDLDTDGDGKLQWGEVRKRQAEIADFVAAHLRLDDGRCHLQPGPFSLDRKADAVYAVIAYGSDCRADARPSVAYSLFRDVDPTHRGLLIVLDAERHASGPVRSLVPGGPAAPIAFAAPAAGTASAADAAPPASGVAAGAADAAPPASGVAAAPPPEAEPPPVGTRGGFFVDGLHHILIGADHVLFLICLLLPLALGRASRDTAWRSRFLPLLGLVTAFTVAHSITLGLAAWRVVAVSPRVIEPLIAATIALAAADNIWPLLGRKRVLAAFAFGLIHGFGFAGPLLELDLAPLAMAKALLQFNLGVEAGQLMVVAALMLLLWPLRSTRHAATWLRGGSAVAGVLALVWLAERLLDVKVLPV